VEPTTGGGARYHPCVIWGPFLLALALGFVVSAGLYFAYLWPQVEPDEEGDEVASSEAPAQTEPAPETEAETEAPDPASETSPA